MRYISFPNVDKIETVAYQKWTEEKIKNKVNINDYSSGSNWRKSPDGLIQQWLEVESGSYEYKRFIFPRAFTNKCFMVFVCDYVSKGNFSPADVAVGEWDNTGFYLKSGRDTNKVLVLAIGV